MRMTNLLLSVLILTFFLFSCSKEQQFEPEKKFVSVWAGETSYVNIKTDLTQENYTLISENQEIATATFDKQPEYICVSTQKSGNTVVRLIETDNNKTICEIFIDSKYFNSRQIIDWGIPVKDNPGIVINASDANIQKTIEKELLEKSKPFIGTIYTFNQETKKFTMNVNSGIHQEGTYEWDIHSLTLMYDGKVEKFGFSFAKGRKNEYIIQSDKTKEYQQKYPNGGITEVKVNHIWEDNGIIVL